MSAHRKPVTLAVFYFKPAAPDAINSPCRCSRRKDTCYDELRVSCGHVEHATWMAFRAPAECIKSICKKPVGGRGNHHHHTNERAKVMARLESQLQRDGLTYRETLADGTRVYARGEYAVASQERVV